MIRSVLASLTGHGADTSVLETAVAIGKAHDATVQALHVSLSAENVLALSAFTTKPWEIAESDRKQQHEARRAFDETCSRHPALAGLQGGLVWRDLAGDGFNDTAFQARLNDLVVIGRDTATTRGRAGALVMQIGRPVILAPARPPEKIGKTIAVAWKNSAESAKALTAAMPLIELADRVVLISVSEQPDTAGANESELEQLKANLARNGVPIDIAARKATVDTAASTVRAAAYEANCDLLVMGAYGHSRMREFVFGGFTREMLEDDSLPVLMCH